MAADEKILVVVGVHEGWWIEHTLKRRTLL